MPRLRVIAACCSLALLSGCLTFYSKSEVVRDDEARRPVKFECGDTSEQFHETMKKHGRVIGSTHFGVPFVTVYSRNRSVSTAAAWNDAVAECDTDQDGTITHVEALMYAKCSNP